MLYHKWLNLILILDSLIGRPYNESFNTYIKPEILVFNTLDTLFPAISPRYPSITTTDALKPTGYVDSDYARDIDTRRSVTGYIFLLAGAPISWQSRQQPSFALSSMECEYMAACAAAQEAVWLIQLLKEFTCNFFHPVILFEDNKACLEFVKNNNNAKRSKHIDVRYHFISDLERDKVITLSTSVRSQDNLADIMTKPLDKTTFARLSSKFMRVIN